MFKLLAYVMVIISCVCFPGLALNAYFAYQEAHVLEDRISSQQRQLAGLAMRIDRQRRAINYVADDVEKIADEMLARCVTKTPRPPMRLKGGK